MAKNEIPETRRDPKTIAVKEKEIAFRPKNFDELWRFATLICKTEFVPNQFRNNPGACLAAIQTGHELGLPPMASLQSIAVINGRPTVWGEGALALVKAHPLCDWVHELPADEALICGYGLCTIKRKGDPDPTTRKFSLEMAQKAGLIERSGAKGVWTTYQGRMLQMRARAWAMRDAIPEALKGVAIREEVEDYEQMAVAQDKQLPSPNGKPALEQLKATLKAEAEAEAEAKVKEISTDSLVVQATTETVNNPQVGGISAIFYESVPQPVIGDEPKPDPIDALLAEITVIDTMMQFNEFRYHINKKLKVAGIKDEMSIEKISLALNEKKTALEKVS